MKRLSRSQIVSQLGLARESYGRGDSAGALRLVDAILRSNPDSFEAHFGRATILLAMDRGEEALQSFKQVLRYEPNSRDALLWAAQTAVGLGRGPEAEAFALRLTRLDPKNDRAHFLLSIAQSQSGRLLDAVESVTAALNLKPNDLNYLVGKGQLLTRLHAHALAIEMYRRALAIERAPQIAKELAEVLLEEGQADEALSLIEPLAGSFADDASFQVLLGRAYSEAGRLAESESHWSNARAAFGSHSQYINERARHEIASGRIEEAESLLREGLRDDPADVQLFALLAPIVTFTDAEADQIGAMEAMTESHSPLTRQTLAYALGKAFNDLGDYRKAMSHFDRANHLRQELTPDGLQFNAVEWTARVDLQINSFSRERIGEGLESELPLFVVGMIRSGTTLTEQILSCHSQIAAGGEISFWVDHCHKVADPLGAPYDPEKARRIGLEYLKNLERSRRFVVDKNPLNVMMAATLHSIFPNSRILHLKRDAVDNLLSIWMTPLTSGLQFIATREQLVFAYREYLRLASHLESVLPPDRFRTFSYEDLTSEPEPTIGAMLDFVGVGMEEACLHPERNPRTVRTPSMYQVRRPINTESQARWKRYEPWLGEFAELIGQ